jgi:hypothetical protein
VDLMNLTRRGKLFEGAWRPPEAVRLPRYLVLQTALLATAGITSGQPELWQLRPENVSSASQSWLIAAKASQKKSFTTTGVRSPEMDFSIQTLGIVTLYWKAITSESATDLISTFQSSTLARFLTSLLPFPEEGWPNANPETQHTTTHL